MLQLEVIPFSMGLTLTLTDAGIEKKILTH